jgi:hypothetical protein
MQNRWLPLQGLVPSFDVKATLITFGIGIPLRRRRIGGALTAFGVKSALLRRWTSCCLTAKLISGGRSTLRYRWTTPAV